MPKCFYLQLTAGRLNSPNKTSWSRGSPVKRSTTSATITRRQLTRMRGGPAGARVMVGTWPASRPSPPTSLWTTLAWRGSPGEAGFTTSPLQTSSEFIWNNWTHIIFYSLYMDCVLLRSTLNEDFFKTIFIIATWQKLENFTRNFFIPESRYQPLW